MLAGCVQTPADPSYRPVSLPEPYRNYPDPPPGTAIEAGVPVKLDERQQEAVVSAILKWMKDPRTAELVGWYLAPLGIGSMMDAPVFAGGVLAGALCHEHVGPPREWTED